MELKMKVKCDTHIISNMNDHLFCLLVSVTTQSIIIITQFELKG
jgi:hypothetical protein